MVGFFSKKVADSETLSEKLAVERKKQGLTLKTVAHKLKIKEDYLKSLEQGDYQNLPGEIYIKNFLRSYLQFLNLPVEPLLALYQQEKEARRKMGQVFDAPPRLIERVTGRRLAITPKIIRLTVAIIVALVCLAYLGLELKKIVTPPFLAIDQPANNLRTADYFVEVRGRTEAEAKLLINGQEVLGNRVGEFAKRLDLQAGLNTIKISAVKKYGRPSVIYRNVLVDSPAGEKPEENRANNN
ncbi:MAG: helix-turn-helix domain-containing protein [bacterium]